MPDLPQNPYEILKGLQAEYYENQYIFGDFSLDPIVYLESVYFDKFAIVQYHTSSHDRHSTDLSKIITGYILAVNLARRICMEHKDTLAGAILAKNVDEPLLRELIRLTLSARTHNNSRKASRKTAESAHFISPADNNDYILFESVNDKKGIQIFSHTEQPLNVAFKALSEGKLMTPLIVSRNKNRAAGFFLALMAEKGLLPDNYLEIIKDNHLLVTVDEKKDVPIQSLKNGKSENWPYLTEYELDTDDDNIYSRIVKALKSLDVEGKFNSHPLPYSIPVSRCSFRN